MKRFVIMVCLASFFISSEAQTTEAEQLALNIEKLKQFKKILQNMYTGYKIIYSGYTAVKNISEGNFSLHKNFLDALLDVSPAVKKYSRIAGIIDYQLKIVGEYKSAFGKIKEENNLTVEELEQVSNVFGSLLARSLKSLEELSMVLTAGTMRMSDSERLCAIDKIYQSVSDQFFFLHDYASTALLLSAQRSSEKNEISISKQISGIK